MPDGRIIPTCVIYAPKKESPPPPVWNLNFPSEIVGGGYPIFTEVQDEQHVASISCLVTDGDLTFALTNKHVTGEKLSNEQGRHIFTLINSIEFYVLLSEWGVIRYEGPHIQIVDSVLSDSRLHKLLEKMKNYCKDQNDFPLCPPILIVVLSSRKLISDRSFSKRSRLGCRLFGRMPQSCCYHPDFKIFQMNRKKHIIIIIIIIA
jgi:hypothetical protein